MNKHYLSGYISVLKKYAQYSGAPGTPMAKHNFTLYPSDVKALRDAKTSRDKKKYKETIDSVVKNLANNGRPVDVYTAAGIDSAYKNKNETVRFLQASPGSVSGWDSSNPFSPEQIKRRNYVSKYFGEFFRDKDNQAEIRRLLGITSAPKGPYELAPAAWKDYLSFLFKAFFPSPR